MVENAPDDVPNILDQIEKQYRLLKQKVDDPRGCIHVQTSLRWTQVEVGDQREEDVMQSHRPDE
jgi:hypothetical protein